MKHEKKKKEKEKEPATIKKMHPMLHSPCTSLSLYLYLFLVYMYQVNLSTAWGLLESWRFDLFT